jgi:hypothetical protein
MIDVSTDALDWIVRESAIPYTKMTLRIKEIRTRIAHTPNRRDIACAAIFTPYRRNPADMLEEMM